MILICGGLADGVTELVCSRLRDCGFLYRFVDLATYPADFQVCWHWRGSYPEGYIAGPDWKVDLGDLTGVYVRFLGPEGRNLQTGIEQESAATIFCEYDTGLQLMFESLSCTVINRAHGGYSNNSKPYQALLVRRHGLLTPPTLITNDPAAALEFYKQCDGQVIYKSVSGIRSIVRRLTPDQFARLPLLRNGPAQFQAFIPGDNVRVHTVGEQVFSARVCSEAVDYRYASREGHDVTMETCTLPTAVADSCRGLAAELDLGISGIDLKLTPHGEYYCFEVNPSPGFLYYEKYSRQPISLALAHLLHQGPNSKNTIPGNSAMVASAATSNAPN